MSNTGLTSNADEGAVKRALIADDEPTLVRFSKLLLRREGFEVEAVEDGLLVLEKVREFRPDVLVLDLLLPNMDGFKVLRQLRARPETARLKVLVCSGLTERDYILKAFEEGADDYIQKPFEPEDFLLRILKLTRGQALHNTESILTRNVGDEVAPWIRGIIQLYHELFCAFEDRTLEGCETGSIKKLLHRLEVQLHDVADVFDAKGGGEEDLDQALHVLRELIEDVQEQLKGS